MIGTSLPGPVPASTLSGMAPATRPAAGPEADRPACGSTRAAPLPLAPRTAVAATSLPREAVTAVDLSPPGDPTEVPLDVAAAPHGGAHVLVGRPPLGPPTRLLTVTARGGR